MRGRQRVVLCERYPALARLLVEFLSNEGFDLTVCTALAEIETALERDPSAIVVTDSWRDGPPGERQPDIQGLRRLAERTSVVLTTAWVTPAHLAALEALGLGAALRVVPKPYALDELLVAITSAVAAHRRRR
jgi:DNA-binding response OmpR family regulator